MQNNNDIERARAMIQGADALLIGAGAGMGVDSGLPDFRGNEGFWKAYPPFRGRSFADLANPDLFETQENLAWGFYGHRLNLYRETVPHAGYQILLDLIQSKTVPSFVFTSNVDGHFLRAGFDADLIEECHGSIHHLQCTVPCGSEIWSAELTNIIVNPESFEAQGDLPTCPKCGSLARPNILMFGDDSWISKRTDGQNRNFSKWKKDVSGHRIVAIELGAGTAIPSVRWACMSYPVVRINPRDFAVSRDGDVGLAMGALEGLMRMG